MPVRLNSAAAGFQERFTEIVAAKREVLEDVDAAVAGILRQVREEGDRAVARLTAELDRLALAPGALRVPEAELARAAEACGAVAREDLEAAATRIEAYHRRQLPEPFEFTDSLGVRLGQRWTAVDSVGLYVPGGRAAYPSSVLMNAVPAKVAGVARLAITVPAPDGHLNPLVLAAARVAGVGEVYRIGGAQAVGALAYGTESIAPVDKIVGPGNAYVAAAKRQVFGTVGIDTIAGPSEILVVADGDNDPAWIAADLLSQAEHDPVSQAVLITDDEAFASAVIAVAEAHLEALPKSAVARESWDRHGLVITVGALDEAPALVDAIAPEHLELAVADPDGLAAKVRHAGAIFLGRYAPEALGDYVAGPSHVLPTSRSARFSSGLSVLDFMKRTSTIACSREGLATLAPGAIRLAKAEGLEAHALSLAIRLDGPPAAAAGD